LVCCKNNRKVLWSKWTQLSETNQQWQGQPACTETNRENGSWPQVYPTHPPQSRLVIFPQLFYCEWRFYGLKKESRLSVNNVFFW
jgi:hypothetical protein